MLRIRMGMGDTRNVRCRLNALLWMCTQFASSSDFIYMYGIIETLASASTEQWKTIDFQNVKCWNGFYALIEFFFSRFYIFLLCFASLCSVLRFIRYIALYWGRIKRKMKPKEKRTKIIRRKENIKIKIVFIMGKNRKKKIKEKKVVFRWIFEKDIECGLEFGVRILNIWKAYQNLMDKTWMNTKWMWTCKTVRFMVLDINISEQIIKIGRKINWMHAYMDLLLGTKAQ